MAVHAFEVLYILIYVILDKVISILQSYIKNSANLLKKSALDKILLIATYVIVLLHKSAFVNIHSLVIYIVCLNFHCFPKISDIVNIQQFSYICGLL